MEGVEGGVVRDGEGSKDERGAAAKEVDVEEEVVGHGWEGEVVGRGRERRRGVEVERGGRHDFLFLDREHLSKKKKGAQAAERSFKCVVRM